MNRNRCQGVPQTFLNPNPRTAFVYYISEGMCVDFFLDRIIKSGKINGQVICTCFLVENIAAPAENIAVQSVSIENPIETHYGH